jgi:hypothetical protein
MALPRWSDVANTSRTGDTEAVRFQPQQGGALGAAARLVGDCADAADSSETRRIEQGQRS